MSKTEHDIQSLTMLAIQQAWPNSLVLRQNVGVASDDKGNVVKFGTPGQADLRCVITGLAVEVECKSATGTQSLKQLNYEAAYTRAGGLYIVARDPQEAVREIQSGIDRFYAAIH